MTKDYHDATFKTLMTNREYFVDFCRAYLPSEIQQRLHFESMSLFKANVEYTEKSVDNEGFQSRQADIIYKINYDKDKQACFITVHIEHVSEPDKKLPLRILNYNTSFLLEQMETNPKKPLPAIISIVYYHHLRSPYPYSLDIYDLFEDKALAKQYLLSVGLVDLKKIPDEALAKHGVLYPMEALFKLSHRKGLQEADFDVFFKAIVELKDNEVVKKNMSVLLKYATNALNYQYKPFIKKLTAIVPKWGKMMSTMAQQLHQEGKQLGIQQGMQAGMEKGKLEGLQAGIEKGKLEGLQAGIEKGKLEGLYQTASNMLKEGADHNFVARTTGLSLSEVKKLADKIRRETLH